jgi:hypothetical protein
MPELKEDIPNERWLAEQIDYAVKRGRNSFSVPYFGKLTGVFSQPVKLPVALLNTFKGARAEQSNVRHDDLNVIAAIMRDIGKLPLNSCGEEYLPFITVAHNGEAWINEGNHRIMAAVLLGWPELKCQVRYFDGGQRVLGSSLHPSKLQKLNEVSA